MSAEPGCHSACRCAGQPCVLNEFCQLLAGDLADAACPQQHRKVAVEVRGGEERRRRVLDQRLFVGFGRHPEYDHIAVAFPGLRIERVGPRIAEEDKRLPAYLVDRIVTTAVHDRDMRHGQSQFVYLVDPGWPASLVRHAASVGGLVRTSQGLIYRNQRS